MVTILRIIARCRVFDERAMAQDGLFSDRVHSIMTNRVHLYFGVCLHLVNFWEYMDD